MATTFTTRYGPLLLKKSYRVRERQGVYRGKVAVKCQLSEVVPHATHVRTYLARGVWPVLLWRAAAFNFRGLNFRGLSIIRENRESFTPRKLPAIRYHPWIRIRQGLS